MKNVESKKKLSMGMKNGSVTKIRKHYQTFTCWITILCLLCGYDCCDRFRCHYVHRYVVVVAAAVRIIIVGDRILVIIGRCIIR